MENFCSECGKVFQYIRPKKTCSTECLAQFRSKQFLGIPKSPEHRAKISGANHYAWKGGVAKVGRFTKEYYAWQHSVFKRDDFTCQHCDYRNTRGRWLHAHHLHAWAEFPDERLEIENGLTLCRDCHEILHGRRPDVEPRPCACGCGEMISHRKARQGVRYIRDHSKAHLSPEAKAKMGATVRGRPKTAETRARMATARRQRIDKPHTEIHKDRVAESMRQWWASEAAKSHHHRSGKVKGALNPNAKLTPEQVTEIRKRFTGKRGEYVQFGREYGVRDVTIRRIVLGENW